MIRIIKKEEITDSDPGIFPCVGRGKMLVETYYLVLFDKWKIELWSDYYYLGDENDYYDEYHCENDYDNCFYPEECENCFKVIHIPRDNEEKR